MIKHKFVQIDRKSGVVDPRPMVHPLRCTLELEEGNMAMESRAHWVLEFAQAMPTP